MPERIFNRVEIQKNLKEISIQNDKITYINQVQDRDDRGDSKADQAVVALKNSKGVDPFSYIRFFSNTMSDILDTYLIVLLALDEICEGNM